MRFQIQHIHTVSPGHVDRFDPTRRVAQLAEVGYAATPFGCARGATEIAEAPGISGLTETCHIGRIPVEPDLRNHGEAIRYAWPRYST